MRNRSRLLPFLLATGATVAAVACGGGSSSVTSPDPSAAAGPHGGAAIAGTVQSAAKAAAGQVGSSSVRGLRVTVTGTSLETVTDDAGRFTLQGVPTGRVELRFEGADVDARVTLEGLRDGEMVTVTIRVSGNSASLLDDDQGEVELKGMVDSVGASSLVVDGRTVHVDASTRLLDAKGLSIPLSGFKQGDRVEVKGTAEADGSVLATVVKIEGAGDDEGEEQEVELSGTISSLSPLVVAGRTVKTDASTKYVGGEDHKALTPAEVLKVGNKVEVDGVQKPDGSVLAKKIQLDGEAED